ncbi:hypothetical protein BOX15_Mlig016032g1, partial [Macrostomum lignano]
LNLLQTTPTVDLPQPGPPLPCPDGSVIVVFALPQDLPLRSICQRLCVCTRGMTASCIHIYRQHGYKRCGKDRVSVITSIEEPKVAVFLHGVYGGAIHGEHHQNGKEWLRRLSTPSQTVNLPHQPCLARTCTSPHMRRVLQRSLTQLALRGNDRVLRMLHSVVDLCSAIPLQNNEPNHSRYNEELVNNLEVNIGDQELGGDEQELGGDEQELGGDEQELGGDEQELGGDEQELGGDEQELGGDEQELGGDEQELGGDEQELGGDEQELGGDEQELGGDEQELGGDEQELGGDEQELGGDEQELGGDEQELGGDDQELGGDDQELGGDEQESVVPMQLRSRQVKSQMVLRKRRVGRAR